MFVALCRKAGRYLYAQAAYESLRGDFMLFFRISGFQIERDIMDHSYFVQI